MRLQLKQQEWQVDLGERVGEGGFAPVYRASSAGHPPAVAKLIPKVPGAQRELLFVDQEGVRNVIPILDSGETENHWVIVMPRAERSLRAHIVESPSGIAIEETLVILSDIATTLSDLDGRVVHRDLKPENVLLFGGHWCLADFGISRYAKAATAPDTRKYNLTPEYAAPEQWRSERATVATDIYALGIIGYELLSGSRPFIGPDPDDLREQHLHEKPLHLDGLSPALAALIEECLYKDPGARPSPANVVARLARISEPPASAGLAKLQAANLAAVGVESERARRESEARSEAERRSRLAEDARAGLTRIYDAVRAAISDAAPAVKVANDRSDWIVKLNGAELLLSAPTFTASDPWGGWDRPAFDVVLHASISVTAPVLNPLGYRGRSHSLWYGDVQQAGRYQWFEAAFMGTSLGRSDDLLDPFSLDPGIESAKAIWSGMAEYQLAWPFTPLSIGEMDDFIDRWAAWLAEAAQGTLEHPYHMPERPPQGSFRRS